jgi:hypothetical protein
MTGGPFTHEDEMAARRAAKATHKQAAQRFNSAVVSCQLSVLACGRLAAAAMKVLLVQPP